jgi:hypothetical protein
MSNFPSNPPFEQDLESWSKSFVLAIFSPSRRIRISFGGNRRDAAQATADEWNFGICGISLPSRREAAYPTLLNGDCILPSHP